MKIRVKRDPSIHPMHHQARTSSKQVASLAPNVQVGTTVSSRRRPITKTPGIINQLGCATRSQNAQQIRPTRQHLQCLPTRWTDQTLPNRQPTSTSPSSTDSAKQLGRRKEGHAGDARENHPTTHIPTHTNKRTIRHMANLRKRHKT